jgi:general secretion pathway protein G
MGLCTDPEWQTAELDLKGFAGALELFRRLNARYPSTYEGLKALCEARFLEGPEKPDPWGHRYVYISPGVRHPQSYDLASLGADGKPGGEDDDADVVIP